MKRMKKQLCIGFLEVWRSANVNIGNSQCNIIDRIAPNKCASKFLSLPGLKKVGLLLRRLAERVLVLHLSESKA